jgi:hypothetical protein
VVVVVVVVVEESVLPQDASAMDITIKQTGTTNKIFLLFILILLTIS